MDRLIANQTFSEMLRLDPTQPDSLVFHDPEGHEVELMVSDSANPPAHRRRRRHPGRAPDPRGSRACAPTPRPRKVLPTIAHIGFAADGDHLTLHGTEGEARWYFSPKTGRPRNDMHVGVWHHIAFGAGSQDELTAMREHAVSGPIPYTRIFDHYFFDSCYTMTPGRPRRAVHVGPRLRARREAPGPRRPAVPVAARRAAARQARGRAAADRQPARPRSGAGADARRIAPGSAEPGPPDETLVAATDGQ